MKERLKYKSRKRSWFLLASCLLFCSQIYGQESTTSSLTHYEILNIFPSSPLSEIKKAYRSKALELHPDKLPSNLTNEEKEQLNDLFMKVQLAYEILSDSNKRMEYDLELHGQYMNNQDTLIDFTKQFYQSQSFFALYTTTMFPNDIHVQMKFQMNHPLVQPPDLPLTLSIPLLEVINGAQRNASYFRRKLCPFCQGLGSLPTDCKTCIDCKGLGYNWKQKKWSSLQQMSLQKCLTCHGKGCLPTTLCSFCHGKGSSLQEDWLMIHIPQGFENHQQFVYEQAGHQYSPKIEGNLVATLDYEYPEGYWSNPEKTSDLIYQYNTSLSEVIHGLIFDFTYLNNEVFEVEVPDDVPIEELLLGYDISLPEYGLFEPQDPTQEIDTLIELESSTKNKVSRGDLIVRIKVNLNDSLLLNTLEQIVQVID